MNYKSVLHFLIGHTFSSACYILSALLISGTVARAEEGLEAITPLNPKVLTPRPSTIPSVHNAEIYVKQLNLYRERFDNDASHLSLADSVEIGLTKSPLLGAAGSSGRTSLLLPTARSRGSSSPR